MQVPLGWKNLTHDKRKLAVCASGVAFAVVLILSQLGFRNALLDSQVEMLRRLNCDLVLVSRTKYRMPAVDPISRRRLYQALGANGVTDAFPLYIETFFWKNPELRTSRMIRMLAIRPGDPVFLDPKIKRLQHTLKMPDVVLMDTRSRSEFGPATTGLQTEVSGRQIRVSGTFDLGTDFAVKGNVIASDRTFLSLTAARDGRATLDRMEFGLLKLAPHADLESTAEAVRLRVPSDVDVLTKQQLIDREWRYWLTKSPVGKVFNLGTVVAFLVGIVICYQVLFTEISDHLPQFATLRAIGHGNARLMRVVIAQAFYLALFGFVPGSIIGAVLYKLLSLVSGLRMRMTPSLLISVFVLTVTMCLISGALAARKAMTADPAEVF